MDKGSAVIHLYRRNCIDHKETPMVNNRFRTVIVSLFLSTICAMVFAEEAEKLKVTPTGRIFIDGASFFTPQKDYFPDGIAIPDVRLGVMMNYEKWSASINIGFNQSKVGLRGIFLGYNFNDRLLIRMGSFVYQYGLRTTLSSASLAPMISPIANTAFNDGRQLGAMLVYYPDKYLAALSLHTESGASSNILGTKEFAKEGIGTSTRLVFRPYYSMGKVVQFGISGGLASPRQHLNENGEDTHDVFEFKSNFPSRVVQVSAINAVVDKAVNKWHFSPELLLNYKNLALESQYYYNRVNRHSGLPSFTGQGMYVILRGLLRGSSYNYSRYAGVLDNPNPQSLEFVLDYDYTDLSDSKARIYGGRANNVSITFNYYINKYIIARFRYGYTHTWDRFGEQPISLNSIMVRLQMII